MLRRAERAKFNSRRQRPIGVYVSVVRPAPDAGLHRSRRERIPEVVEIKALAAAGAEIVGPDRVALNPDYEFAPGFPELPSIEEAYEKFSHMAEAPVRWRQRFGRELPSEAARRAPCH